MSLNERYIQIDNDGFLVERETVQQGNQSLSAGKIPSLNNNGFIDLTLLENSVEFWNFKDVSSNYIANNKDALFVDTRNSIIEITFPSNPNHGDMIYISDKFGSFSKFYCSINPNGKLLDDDISNFEMDVDNLILRFVYDDTGKGWTIDVGGRYQRVISFDNSQIPSFNYINKNDDYTAKHNDYIFIDTRLSPINITLPLTPIIGTTVIIHDCYNTFSINHVNVLRNGEKIIGIDDDYLCDIDSSKRVFTYFNSSRGWLIST